MLNTQYDHTLTAEDRLFCDKQISREEVRNIVFKKMSKNKSFGLDGLPVEFYQRFWNDLEDFFLILLDIIYKEGQLSNSQRKSVITLLYKKGEKTNISNYRPLSLTGTDYKILAFILAERVQNVIYKLINTDQTGYIKGRFIGTNIRLVDDVIWYANKKNLPGAILFLDFKKAFDSLEWDFMFQALKKYDFGEKFLKWVRILYNKPTACIKNSGWLSETFELQRGVTKAVHSQHCFLFFV